MYSDGFRKLFWAFIFIMIDFRINGFDILPDIIGYIFIFQGLSILEIPNEFFERAKKLIIPMIILSIPSIYVIQGSDFDFGLGLGTIIGIIAVIIELLLIYSIFMGIKQMGEDVENEHIVIEAKECWKLYLTMAIASLVSIIFVFIPFIFVVYFVIIIFANIFVLIKIVKFMDICKYAFDTI